MTNDKDSAVLEPCPVPWCEKADPPQVWSPDYAPMYTVDCPDCGLETNDFPTEAEAIAAWNTRQPTQSDALLTKMNKWCKAVAVQWGQGSQTHNIARDAVDIVRAALQEQSK